MSDYPNEFPEDAEEGVVRAKDWNKDTPRLDTMSHEAPKDLEFTDFSEYEDHLATTYASQRRRISGSFIRGIMVGLLTSSLIWFIVLVTYGVITR